MTPEFEEKHRSLARAEARRWDADLLVERYEAFFRSMGRGPICAGSVKVIGGSMAWLGALVFLPAPASITTLDADPGS